MISFSFISFTYLLIAIASTQGSCAPFNNASVSASTTRTVSLATARPTNAVKAPADFVGFGYATAFLNWYDNQFSENLVSSVPKRMSQSPIIRIGGTEGDRFTYDPSQTQNTTHVPNQKQTYILGPGYFEGFNAFADSRMTFQAPLGGTLNTSNTLTYVQKAWAKLGANRTAAIALGNEVGSEHYTDRSYTNAAHQLQHNITQALNLTGRDAAIFEVLDLSVNAAQYNDPPPNLPGAFNAGLNDNNLTSLAAAHYYQIYGTKADNIQALLMNHSAIEQGFTNYAAALAYLNKAEPHVPFALTETGSVLDGKLSVAGGFGAALGAVDFQLYCMSQGVARVAATQRPVVGHSLWIPRGGVGNFSPDPVVQPPFYAEPFMADFLGKPSAQTPTEVVDLKFGEDFLTGYAAYNGETLARVALVNLRAWASGNGTMGMEERGSVAVRLGGLGDVQSVKVERLQADAGWAAMGFDEDRSGRSNVTWAGEQWTYAVDDGRGHIVGENGTVLETVNVQGGMATVNVPDTEAVIVYVT